MRCADHVTCVLVLVHLLALGLEAFMTRCYHHLVSRPECSAPEAPLGISEAVDELARVHLVYASDAAYFAGLLSAMLSVAQHLSSPGSCTIHLVVPEHDLAAARGVARCFEAELASVLPALPTMHLHKLRPLYYNLSLAQTIHSHHATQLTFVRLHLHEYLPTVARAIFLDTDTIVLSDLRPLYRMRMAHAMAAAPDGAMKLHKLFTGGLPKIERLLEGLKEEWYFNPGVLVVDIVQWRSQNLSRAINEFAEETSGFMVDLLPLNLALHGRVDLIDWRWNVLGVGGLLLPARCQREARVVHWSASKHKPWQRDRPFITTLHDYLYTPYEPRSQCEALP